MRVGVCGNKTQAAVFCVFFGCRAAFALHREVFDLDIFDVEFIIRILYTKAEGFILDGLDAGRNRYACHGGVCESKLADPA